MTNGSAPYPAGHPSRWPGGLGQLTRTRAKVGGRYPAGVLNWGVSIPSSRPETR